MNDTKKSLLREYHLSPAFTYFFFGTVFLIGFAGSVPDEPPLNVCIIGDTQTTTAMEYALHSHETERVEPDIVFRLLRVLEDSSHNSQAIIHVGDITSTGSSDESWMPFDSMLRRVNARQIEFLSVIGNHEYMIHPDAGVKNFLQRFRHFNFLKTIRGVTFIGLNTNFNMLSNRAMQLQKRWFENKIDSLEKDEHVRAIVVVGHHPPYTNSTTVSPDSVLRRDYISTFIESKKGKLWLSGHCHSLESFVVSGKRFVVTGGGGGYPQHLNTGKSGDPIDQVGIAGQRPYHFLRMSENPSSDEITVSMISVTRKGARSRPLLSFTLE